MTPQERKVMELALEALERLDGWLALRYGSGLTPEEKQTVTAIKEALSSPNGEAQPEQRSVSEHLEFVACVAEVSTYDGYLRKEVVWNKRIDSFSLGTKLYTTPPQRTWVGLTPQERDEINEQVYGAVPHHVAFHHAIETKLKELNT